MDLDDTDMEALWYEVDKETPDIMVLIDAFGNILGTVNRESIEQLLDAFKAAEEDR